MKNRVRSMVAAVTAFCIAGGMINTGIIFPAVNDGTVFAEQDGSAAAPEEIVRQSVAVNGGSMTLTNGMITLYYDPDLVSLKDVTETTQLSGMTVSINKDVPGRIVIGFVSVDPVKVSGDIVYADFEYKAGISDIPQFGMRINELETEDADGNIIEADEKRLKMAPVDATVVLSSEMLFRSTDANGNIGFDLKTYADPLAPVTEGECTVSYDPAVMTFASAKQIEKTSAKVKVSETEPGTLKITFSSDQNIGDSVLTHLSFRPLKNVVSDIVLKTDVLKGKVSDKQVLVYPVYSGARSQFGIDVPAISDRLPFNRKGTFRIETDEKISVTNGMLTVKYNADKLELKDIRLSDSLNGAAVNTDVPGKIVIGFASADPVALDGTLADIDFAFPSSLSGVLESCSFSVNELENENEDGTVSAVDPLHISGDILAPQYGIDQTADDKTVETGFAVKLGRNSGVTNGSFVLDFDPEVLTFSGAAPAAEQKGLMVDANEVSPGKVKCVFVSEKPVTADGELLILKFKPLKSCRTKIELDPLELLNVVSEDNIYEYYIWYDFIKYFNIEASEPVVTTEPAVTTAAVAPVTSEAPVTTAAVAPVTSEAPVTTAAVAPVTSAAPVTAVTVNPVTSVAPVTTAAVAPVTSAAPVTAVTVNPVTSVAPVTTAAVAPVTSAAPVTAVTVNPVTSVAAVTTAKVAPVTSAAPVTTVNPVTSAVPAVTTAKVAPVTSVAPVTAVTVNPVTSAAPVTTAKVAPVTSAAPVTAVTVNPVTSAAPVTTAAVVPVTSAAPVTAVTVNPVTSEAPVTTAAVAPVTSEAPVTAVTANPVTSEVVVTTASPVPVKQHDAAVHIGSDDTLTVSSGKIVLNYDPEQLTYEGIELSDQISKKISEISTSEPGKIVIGFDSKEPIVIDSIADVKFTYADGITDPASVCTLDVQKLETIDETGTAKPVDPSSLTVSKAAASTEPDYDINSDGTVNTKDLLSLIKMIIDPTAAKKVTADLTGDGKINAEDIIAIKKLLAQ